MAGITQQHLSPDEAKALRVLKSLTEFGEKAEERVREALAKEAAMRAVQKQPR